jgi:phosphoribosylglycinamide formyltransferase 2
MSSAALKTSQDIAFKITSEIGGLGLFGVELFVKGDTVWFSEVSPRPHDTGMVTMATQKQNEFELHARAILGLPVHTCMHSVGASAVILGGIDAKGVVYEGLEKALTIPTSEIRLFGKPESFINRRMGVALTTADTVDEARSRAVKAASMIIIKAE